MQRPRPRKPRLSRIDAAIDAMAQLGFPAKSVRICVKQLLKEYGGNEAWPFIEEYSYKELIEAILRYNEEHDKEIAAEGGGDEQSKPTKKGPENTLEETTTEPSETSHGIITEAQTDNETAADLQAKTDNGSSSQLPNKRKRLPSHGWIVSEEDEEEDCPNNAVVDATKKIDRLKDLNSSTPCTPSLRIPKKEPIKKVSVPCYGWIEEEEEKEGEACPSNGVCDKIANGAKKRRHFPCYGWIDDDDENEGSIEFAYSTPAQGWFCEKPVGEGKRRQSKWDQSPVD